MGRQAVQSLIQFASVFLSGLAVYKGVPTSLDEVWQPFIQGLLAAIAIYSGRNVGRRFGAARHEPLSPPQ